jgi:hypothetical protein
VLYQRLLVAVTTYLLHDLAPDRPSDICE